jgi:hypothetical protein
MSKIAISFARVRSMAPVRSLGWRTPGRSALLLPQAPATHRGRAATVLLEVLVLGAFAMATPTLQGQEPGSVADLVSRSGFIFQGTVKAIGAATPTVTREPNTAVVVVDRVLEALPPVGNIKGKEVTVRLKDATRVRAGQSATFFTYVYSAGTSLGLDEVGILPSERADGLTNEIPAARQALADSRLAARLASAQLVIVGVVGDARPIEGVREPASEHDPLWRSTPLRVESTLKGNPGTEPVSVNIATSDDHAWDRAPKPKPGAAGIFLLQPDTAKRFHVPGLFLVDPLDVLDRNQLDRVRRLLNTPR